MDESGDDFVNDIILSWVDLINKLNLTISIGLININH